MKKRIIILFLIVVVIYLFYYHFLGKRIKLSRLVKADLKKYGIYTETDKEIYPFLINAWRSVGLDVNENNILNYDDEKAWSAAAVSYWMQKAGISSFPKSASHSHYILKAKIKRETGLGDSKLELYRISEFKPRVGDLICYSRGSQKVNYDTIYEGAKTHCDVVVDVFNDRVIGVGGNVSDKIKDTTYYTKDGFVSQSLNNKSFIGVIKNRHF